MKNNDMSINLSLNRELGINNITKRAKKVDVYVTPITTYTTSYRCPSCHTEYSGFISSTTERFRCSCGQLLIVNKHIKLEK